MTARAGRPILTGRRVLVVEDEALIAMQIEAELEDAGCTIVGPAATAALALRLIQREAIDAAVSITDWATKTAAKSLLCSSNALFPSCW